MKSEMKTKALRFLSDIQTGPFGSQLHKEDYVDDGTPIVTVEHLGNRVFTEQNLPRVSNEDKQRLSKYILKEGDIVFSRVGSVDRCSFVDSQHTGWLFSGRCLRVRPFEEISPLFLYYFFCLESTKKFIRNIAVGATMPSINTKLMGEIEVSYPDKQVQEKIANLLGAIDNKIELNNAINDNLAAQMRAYFKEYTANNASITGKLKDYSVMQYGYTETATTEPVGPKFLRITDIAQNYIDWNGVPYCPISEENHEKYVLSEGDVVVARTGATVGYAKMVGRNIPDSVFASFLVRIRPIDDEYRYYFGLAITSAEFLNFVQTNAGGSAQPQANPPLLGEFELSIPNKQSLPEFNTKISSFLGVIESNETEISKLHEVKDTMVKMLSSR